MSEHEEKHDDDKKDDKRKVIHIDREVFKVEEDSLTGAQLRALPETDISQDYDLWLEFPGGQDVLIEDEHSVKLKNGQHFFSVQKTINPGR